MDPAFRPFIIADLAGVLARRPPLAPLGAALDELCNGDWVALDAVMPVLQAAAEREGLDGLRALSREATHATNGGPAMRLMIQPVARLLRHRPQQFFRWVPFARDYATRGLGRSRYEDAVCGCSIVVRGMPSALARDPVFEAQAVGAMQGFLDFARLDGSVAASRRGDDVDYIIDWRPLSGDARGPDLADLCVPLNVGPPDGGS